MSSISVLTLKQNGLVYECFNAPDEEQFKETLLGFAKEKLGLELDSDIEYEQLLTEIDENIVATGYEVEITESYGV